MTSSDDKNAPRDHFADLIEDGFFCDNPNGSDIDEELKAFLSAYDRVCAERDEYKAEHRILAEALGKTDEMLSKAKAESYVSSGVKDLRKEREELKSKLAKAIAALKEIADSRKNGVNPTAVRRIARQTLRELGEE
jgi:hypothetical protein